MASGIKHRGSAMKKFLILLICILSVSVIYAENIDPENLEYNFHFTKKSENYLVFCDSTGAEESEFYFIPSSSEEDKLGSYELTLGVKYNIYDASYNLKLVFTSGIAASGGTGGYMLSLIKIDDSGNSVLSNEIGLNYSVAVKDCDESINFADENINRPLDLDARTITIESKTEDATRNNESNGMKTKEVTLTLKPPKLEDSTDRAFSSGVYAGNIILRLESNS